jgi:hypothetical protein
MCDQYIAPENSEYLGLEIENFAKNGTPWFPQNKICIILAKNPYKLFHLF